MTDCCRASCRWRLARTDCPWAATVLTAACAIIFLGCGRSHLDDRRRQLHLSHRHLHAEHRGLAVAARPAQRRPTVSRAARHHHTRRGCGIDLAALGDPRLPAVRPADRSLRPRARLHRGSPLRLARNRGPQAAGAACLRAHAAPEAHRRHAVRADPGWNCLPPGRQHRLERAQRAGVGFGRHLRRRRTAYDQRRLGTAGHDHLLGAGGERGRETVDMGNAARFHARNAGPRARRSAGRARLRQHRAREDQLPRRAGGDGCKLQSAAGAGQGRRLRARRSAREHAHGARGAARAPRGDRASCASRCAD